MLRGWTLFIVVFLLGCSEFAVSPDNAAIVKSPNDQSTYRYLQLDNGLEVLLVADPKADKAAAALDVFAGSAQDPADRQGLAHFLEHMLFLGTDKYPDPGEYQAFISAHGGSHNAYTAFRHTNYFFDIDPLYFDQALDRFSRFFVAPLFNSEYVEREKNAVHSEYQARIKNDFRRQLDVFQQLVNDKHPASTFSVGSLETLADKPGAPVRDALLNFYQRYYSSDRMALAVVAPESLDALEARVRELFDPVVKRDAAAVEINEPLFTPDSLPAVVRIKPVQEMRELAMLFPVPDDTEFYREKVLSYLGNLLGHEGEGSLLALLKKKGYAEGLSAGAALNDGNQSAFQISINLTPLGEERWREVVALVFNSIELIRQQGVEQWRYKEQASLTDMQYRFLERTSPIHYASQLAGRMHDYPVADLLRGPFRMDRYDRNRIMTTLGKLTADNVLISITAPNVVTDRLSPFYQTAYSVAQPEQQSLRTWLSPVQHGALQLPAPNPYVPKDFALIDAVQKTKPQLLDESLWYVPDSRFGVPKVYLKAAFQSSLVNSVESTAMSALLLSVVEESLNTEAYPAALAGLGYNFSLNPNGFGFSVGGFGDKISVLLGKIVQRLQTPTLDPATVARVREELIRDWRNSTKSEPYRQVWSKVSETLEMTHYDPLDMAAALEDVTLETLESFAPTLFNGSRLTLLAGGNLTEQRARKLARRVVSLVNNTESSTVAPRRGVVKLEKPHHRNIAIDHSDTALIRYYQGRKDTLQEQARFMVQRQLLKAPFFNELRTEQQLGYVVAAVDITLDRMPGVGFLVQSPSANSVALTEAIETFLSAFPKQLEQMDEAQLEKYRAAVIATLEENPKNLAERISRDWQAIDLHYFSFDIRDRLIEEVRAYTLEEVRTDFEEIFLNGNRWLQIVNTQESVAASDSLQGKLIVLPLCKAVSVSCEIDG